METIVFHHPRKLVFGRGCFQQLAEDLLNLGKKRLYIVTIPLLAAQIRQEMEALSTHGISFTINDDLNSEPGFSHFYRFLEEAEAFQPDCIVGIGGGSVLDVAKLLAALADSEQKLEEVVGIGLLKSRNLCLVCLPTTSGTGSEVSPNALLLPYVMEYNMVADPDHFQRVALALGAEQKNSAEESALEGVAVVRSLMKQCGLPSKLSAIGIPADAIPGMAVAAVKIQRLLKNNIREISVADAVGIYQKAF